MKSTPMELRNFYLPGHPKHSLVFPEGKAPKLTGQRKVGGFVFTDGAMSLYLPAVKAERNAKFLKRFFDVDSEVLQRVDVPARARVYSPKSEAQGVLGLVDEDAAPAEGVAGSGDGGQPARTGGPDAASLEAIRGNNRGGRTTRRSSVATATKVDPATRAALMSEGGDDAKAPASQTPPGGEGGGEGQGTEGLT